LAVDTLAAALPGKLPSALTTALTALLFLGLSLKSRTFNPLRNTRPDRAKAIKGESTSGFNDRTMPSWTPPGVTFPIMWVLVVAPLRAFATVCAAGASGGHLCNAATLSLVLHLSVGDTWNTVNNVERRTGAAVPGVALVWASCAAAVLAHARLPGPPLAARALGVTLVWITVAAALVADTWRVNGREPLYPVKRAADQPQTQFAWFQPSSVTAPAAEPAPPSALPPPLVKVGIKTIGFAGTLAAGGVKRSAVTAPATPQPPSAVPLVVIDAVGAKINAIGLEASSFKVGSSMCLTKDTCTMNWHVAGRRRESSEACILFEPNLLVNLTKGADERASRGGRKCCAGAGS
jgi:tryptophan-rich sensory protein